jgi:hypothetical protein
LPLRICFTAGNSHYSWHINDKSSKVKSCLCIPSPVTVTKYLQIPILTFDFLLHLETKCFVLNITNNISLQALIVTTYIDFDKLQVLITLLFNKEAYRFLGNICSTCRGQFVPSSHWGVQNTICKSRSNTLTTSPGTIQHR